MLHNDDVGCCSCSWFLEMLELGLWLKVSEKASNHAGDSSTRIGHAC